MAINLVTDQRSDFSKPTPGLRTDIEHTGIQTFPRPRGIPENFRMKLSNNGSGMKYVHPKNEQTYIRVMLGKSHRKYSHQQKPYVIHMRDGKTNDKFSNVVLRDSPEAHIPMDDHLSRRRNLKLSEEDKKYILNEYLRIILHLSDLEYQKRVWIRGEGPECDDFSETVCHFFDDRDPILKDYKEYNIQEKQYQLLQKFRNAFEAFVEGPRPYLPEEFISTTEWMRIIGMAKEALNLFNYMNDRK